MISILPRARPFTYQGILAALLFLAGDLQAARTWHVDANGGDDERDGLSFATAFRSIQHAADLVGPGDEVILHPGVYAAPVTLRRHGKEDAPVTFRADKVAKNRVVLTGANTDLLSNPGGWTLEDESLRLYSRSYTGKEAGRVLYDGADLYPYSTLDGLKAYTTEAGPGPRHGYFHDVAAGRLYLRLHASGRYGSSDPSAHRIAVGKRDGFGMMLPGKGPGYVIIEGITFETPGDSAIYTEVSCITVRDCWFFGSPYGVRGTNKGRAQEAAAGPYDTASEVLIEHCEYTEISSFDDVSDLLRARQAVKADEQAEWSDIWHRKTTGKHGLPADKKNYENGIAVRMGRGWRVSHNDIHDCFEGLANDGMDLSVDTWIHDNVFARICDNAIETENHARDVRIFNNVFLDVLEPVSWQPLGGPPWPGPVWFYQNVVANTPEMAALWGNPPHETRGIFKMGISLKNWHDGKSVGVSKTDLAVPEPGLLFFNNTLFFPGGRLFSLLGSRDVPVANVIFANNRIATDFVASRQPESDLKPGHFKFFNNTVLDCRGAQEVAGKGGEVVSDLDAMGWVDPMAQNFHRKPGAARATDGIKMPGQDFVLPDSGALMPGEGWYPPKVGPRVDTQP
ncbi:hypothetical protein EI77_02666 [Prosthecobacter fusiformis]|uniref:Parallel beta helix pectate lyase-like protein n=1 Tax=Prosthecobacter fusiformis TaxID=48464 RepID=A0A4R7RZT5_9BACT|nr:hypothetical protein [Prosthecobacter fusiformis]TDU70618.1 hypothetical protein EI77_02666 [Prosthecobacter fusiformis]